MKNRSGVLLLVALLLVLRSVPTSSHLQDSSRGNQVHTANISDSGYSLTWHDDCSNVSGWDESNRNIPGLIWVVQSGIPLLTNGTGIYSDTIPGYAEDSHGSVHIKRLETPAVLSDSLELRVELEHIGTPGMMGSVGVFLLDAAYQPVFLVGGSDVSNESGCGAWVRHAQEGGTINRGNSKNDAWSGVVRVWYDPVTDSIKGDPAGMEVTLRTSGNFNPNRVVHFVGIAFYNYQFNTFESDIIRDILVTSKRDTTIWHHDCSNTTGFTYRPNWPMDWWYEEYEVTSGDMRSSGDYFYFRDIPYSVNPIRWHGPIFVHNLSKPITIRKLVDFSVHLDVDNSHPSYSGIIDVSLCDSEYIPVVSIHCTDSWDWLCKGYNSVVYRYSNLSYVRHGTLEWASWTTFNGTIRAWFDPEMGLMGYVPGYGTATLTSPAEIEDDREITYVVIRAARLTTYTWMPSCIRDILLSPANPQPSTSSTTISTTSTTLTTTTSTNAIYLDNILLLGISFEIVGIAIAITVIRLSKHDYFRS